MCALNVQLRIVTLVTLLYHPMKCATSVNLGILFLMMTLKVIRATNVLVKILAVVFQIAKHVYLAIPQDVRHVTMAIIQIAMVSAALRIVPFAI